MASMSNYLENKIVDWLFRAQTYTPPAGLYFALFTANPTAAGGGTEVSTSSTGYARVNLAPSLTNWAGTQAAASTTASTGTSGQTSNNSVITFGTPTAAWGAITGIGVFDAATGGNLLFFGALSANKTVNNGDPAPSFAASQLSVTLS